MLSIKTTINQKLLTTYWSDGLIISTPTGSTGYSLSSGGPIISPETNTFVLNPIASHNIGIRPLIVPEESNTEIHVSGRSKKHLISLDNRRFSIKNSFVLKTQMFCHTRCSCTTSDNIRLKGKSFTVQEHSKHIMSHCSTTILRPTETRVIILSLITPCADFAPAPPLPWIL